MTIHKTTTDKTSGDTPTAPKPGAPGYIMLPAAGPFSYKQYKSAHWTDAMLIEAGYMQESHPSIVPED